MRTLERLTILIYVHQTVRVCHTDHTDSIVSSMACIFDFFNVMGMGNSSKIVLCLWAMALVWSKLKRLKIQQTVRVCHTDHTDSIVSSMACIFD